MKTKLILVRDWQGMKVHAASTETRATVKKDSHGRLWEWVHGGKRVGAKQVSA